MTDKPLARTDGRRRLLLATTAAATLALLASCASTAQETTAGTKLSGADAAAQLTEVLGLEDGAALGKGTTFKLGAAFPLSGGGATDGEELTNAVDLAVKQIAEAGGPDIEVVYADNKSGDPVASKQAMRELIDAGVPAKLSSYADGLGAMLEDTAKSQMLSFDGVGGAPLFAQGVPFFYGARAAAPVDALPGALRWFKESHPDAKTVGLLGWDLGPFNEPVKAQFTGMIEAAGLEFNGLWEMVPPTATDFSQALSKVKANEPDMLIMGLANQAPAAVTVQMQAMGIEALPLGIEFTQTGLNASKGTWDRDGFVFTMDWFDAEKPSNPLAKLFVDSYQTEYGTKPGFYGANAYEEVLAVWTLIQRVLADGGDPSDSTALLAAMESDPNFASVYGGTADEPGVLGIDPKTHTVSKRPMGVYEFKAGEISPLATYDVAGADFELLD